MGKTNRFWWNLILSSFVLFSPINCKLVRPNEELIDTTQTVIITPTYEGSGQAVHPSIIKLRDNKYLMAITPYPFGNAKFENPQILESINGLDFIILGDSLNPIDFPSKYSHNCDPCLVKNDGAFHLYYVEVELDSCRLKYRKSKNGIEWSEEITLMETDNFGLLSPIVSKKRDKMWVTNAGQDGFQTKKTECYLYHSKNGLDWKEKSRLFFNEDFLIWHFEIKKIHSTEDKYLMLFSGREKTEVKGLSLYSATSKDGIKWDINTTPIIKNSEEYPLIYKSSFIQEGEKIRIWFSKMSDLKVWETIYTERNLETLGFYSE